MAAGEGDINRSLMKEALVESLRAVLSHEQQIRSAGEEHVKTLEITPDFGVHLAELTIDISGHLATRQLASVLLKQYVEVHWSKDSDKFRPPETPAHAKAEIRSLLVQGLTEDKSKVRSSVAYAISAIAHWDWPEEWPDLFVILMQALTSTNPNLIHGAMRVLTEFCREVTDTQMLHVAPVIFPEMYKIFYSHQCYSVRTRARAVNIFDTCSTMIAAINQVDKGIAKQLLFPLLPQFVEVFAASLLVPDGQYSDSGLKMEVLRALTSLVKNFPAHMSRWLPLILSPIWTTLTHNADVYLTTVVCRSPDDIDNNTAIDSDGEVLGFENLVLGIFDFVNALIESSKFRDLIKKSTAQLLHYIIVYMEITEDQVSAWTSNVDQFVEDEDEETFSSSVRISAQDLLMALAAEFPKEVARGLCESIQRHLTEVETTKSTNPSWWKVHESCVIAMGSLSKLMIDKRNEWSGTSSTSLDINNFIRNCLLNNLTLNVSPFLIGRCLWTASRYATIIPPEILHRLLSATVTAIQPEQPPCLRILAVRAVSEYCTHLLPSRPSPHPSHPQSHTSQIHPSTTGDAENMSVWGQAPGDSKFSLLQPYIGDLVEGLISVASQFNTDVLTLCLETIAVVIQVDEQFTSKIEEKVSSLTITVFLKYSADPLIVSLVEDIISVLARNNLCISSLQQKLAPTLLTILHSPVDKLPLGLQSTGLDILTCLVRGYKLATSGGCKSSSSILLPDSLVNELFPAAVHLTLTTDDNSAMQSGGECLRAYVSVASDQICQWHDSHGLSGLYYVLQVVNKLLDPKTSEFTATFVGRLVTVLITRVGSQLADSLDLMLRAVLSKLQQAETLSVTQSLVLVFAHLVHCQLDAVLDFLCSVPSPSGRQTALEFVLAEWCSKQHLFFGDYDRKISSLALCKLVRCALVSNDQRLQNIQVQGDLVLPPAPLSPLSPHESGTVGVRTRSKTAQLGGLQADQWTSVPLLVKIYKLLINELSNCIELRLAMRGDEEEGEGEEEEGGWEDVEEDEMKADEDCRLSILSQLTTTTDLLSDEYEEDGEENEDDFDALSDPMYSIDLQNYLTEFLQSLSQLPCYSVFAQHHNESERRVLAMIDINV